MGAARHRPLIRGASRSWFAIAAWTAGAFVVALLIIQFALRSHNVVGRSMEPTLTQGDVVFVNRLGQTFAGIAGTDYTPARGAIIIFRNPLYTPDSAIETYLVKRIIGLPGDRVVVRDGRITVYPAHEPNRPINPDDSISGPQGPTSGSVDRIVPDHELFVTGDNRQGRNSLDSRNGLSTVPLDSVEGVIALRFWPLNQIRIF